MKMTEAALKPPAIAVRVVEPNVGELVEYTPAQAAVWSALSANWSLRRISVQARMDGISDADMYVDNVCLPTYSELLLAARSLLALTDATGLATFPAFTGVDMSATSNMRKLLTKVGL